MAKYPVDGLAKGANTNTQSEARQGQLFHSQMFLLEPRIVLDAAMGLSIEENNIDDNDDSSAFYSSDSSQVLFDNTQDANEIDNSSLPFSDNDGGMDADSDFQLQPLFTPTQMDTPSPDADTTHIFFIDARHPFMEQIQNNIPPSTLIVPLQPHQDGIAQISKVLDQAQNIESVNIIPLDTSEGGLLGTSATNTDELLVNTDAIALWSDALASQGVICLNGTPMSQTVSGSDFAQLLENITGVTTLTDTTLLLQFTQPDSRASSLPDSDEAGDSSDKISINSVDSVETISETALLSSSTLFTLSNDVGVLPDTPDDSSTNLVFIDTRVEDYEIIAKQYESGATVVLVDSNDSGVEIITQYLAQSDGVDSVSVFSHGESGMFTLGSDTVDSTSISGVFHLDMASWADHLTTNADILLYGCNIAKDALGVDFINQLSQLTGADVAASDDPTGDTALGGDWDLEARVGEIEQENLNDTIAQWGVGGLLGEISLNDPIDETITEGGTFNIGVVVASEGDAGDADLDMIVEVFLEKGSGGISRNNGTPSSSLSAVGSLSAINTFLGELTYVPETDSNVTATIVVRVDQDSSQISSTNTDWTDFTEFNVTITPEADAPTLSGNATLTSADEDSDPSGDSITTLLGGLYNDADVIDSFSGIAITSDGSNSAQGTWEYKVSGGAWTDIGTVGANSALLLDAATQLRFNPADDYNGDPGNLTVHAIDDSADSTGRDFTTSTITRTVNINTGTTTSSDASSSDDGTTDISTNTSNLSTTINPLNDAPTTIGLTESVQKNLPLTFSLSSDDVDAGADNTSDAVVTQYKIVDIPNAATQGILKDADGDPLAAGDMITVFKATNMTFEPVENYTGDITFDFTAIDAASAESNQSTMTITVDAFNEPPVVTVPDGVQTVAEDAVGGLIISGVSLADTDAGDTNVEVTVSTSQGGSITLSSVSNLTFQNSTTNGSATVTVQGTLANINTALNNLTYTPATNFNGDDIITVFINDTPAGGGKTDSENITVSVTPVDDAPVTGAAAMTTIDEDNNNPAGETVSSLLDNFSDVDTDALAGIAVSFDAADAANGTWQYSLDDGVTWNAIGAVSPTAALLLDANSQIRFLPKAQFSGDVGALTVHAIDDSNTAIPRVFTTDPNVPVTTAVNSGALDIDSTGTAMTISVTSINDPLEVNPDLDLTVSEGGSATLTSAILEITDEEADPAQIVYTLTGLPAAGTLKNSGIALNTSDNNTFTQDDIDKNLITFTHDGSEPTVTGTPLTINYTVTDIVDGVGSTETRTLSINVTPVNDAPTISAQSGSLSQGGSLTFSTAVLNATDPDNQAQQLIYSITSLPANGTLTLNDGPVAVGSTVSQLNIGNLKYTHDGGVSTSDTFEVTLRDGAGSTVVTSVTLSIGEVNTAPSVPDATIAINENAVDQVVSFPISDAQTTNRTGLLVEITSIPPVTEGFLSFYKGAALIKQDKTIVNKAS